MVTTKINVHNFCIATFVLQMFVRYNDVSFMLVFVFLKKELTFSDECEKVGHFTFLAFVVFFMQNFKLSLKSYVEHNKTFKKKINK